MTLGVRATLGAYYRLLTGIRTSFIKRRFPSYRVQPIYIAAAADGVFLKPESVSCCNILRRQILQCPRGHVCRTSHTDKFCIWRGVAHLSLATRRTSRWSRSLDTVAHCVSHDGKQNFKYEGMEG
ncbi:hypothetical protein AVEN_270157-1 [Araneus ventricosus]|uniref:Uncharacterized protein n=1 Tax=Araneus ventricosus TaxID=182803 RepID=A0A4Y2XAY3_ARAVE|nr:hypothetical protein AVEN_270157-1 [Araneus ventricosus]